MSDKILDLIAKERVRQISKIGLIPSENHFSEQVAQALSSCLSSKYSEGYPGRRYYEGNQVIDEIENIAVARLRDMFNVPYVNVQAHSGSPANTAIQFSLLQPGEKLMGMKLDAGGHLTHGHPHVTFSGRYFDSVQYGLNSNARVDFEELLVLAKEHRPKAIMVGTTAYPFILDFKKFREIADEVGAWLVADISHITGLVVAGLHPSPVPYADVIMSTTHKTFRGPRGAMILVTQNGLDKDADLGNKINKAIIPGLQGGPHNASIAGIAIATEEAARPGFKSYAQQIVSNCQVLAESLLKHEITLVGGGSENHLLLIDLSTLSPGLGTQAAYALDVAGIYCNRNTIPNEPSSPFYPSGLRLGTPLVTTRGMKALEMEKIASWISRVIEVVKDHPMPMVKSQRGNFLKLFRQSMDTDKRLLDIKDEVKKVAEQFPLFAS